jgi:hypothetical protein
VPSHGIPVWADQSRDILDLLAEHPEGLPLEALPWQGVALDLYHMGRIYYEAGRYYRTWQAGTVGEYGAPW